MDSLTTPKPRGGARKGAGAPKKGKVKLTCHVSPETRAKMSAALQGHPVSDETKAKISAVKLVKMTDELRRKFSTAQKKRWASYSLEKREEIRRAVSNAMVLWVQRRKQKGL